VQVIPREKQTTEGSTVKRFLLLAGLCMAALFVLAPAALANNHNMMDKQMMEGSMMEEEMMSSASSSAMSSASASASAMSSASASASAMSEDEMMEESMMEDEMMEESMMEDEMMSSASAGAEQLADTGGVSPALLTLISALLLVGSGILVSRIVRQG
jgi:hypothetical protein